MTSYVLTSTHESQGINGGYDPVTSQATINALQASMVPGTVIYASDVNSLINLWNAFNNHTHGVDDLYGVFDFGDGYDTPNGPPVPFTTYATPPGSSESTTTDGPSLSGDIATIGAGGVIYAAKANELVSAFAGQAAHTHTWTDRTS
jgi:hypothetical protein